MVVDTLEIRAETIAQKVRHFIITTMRKTSDEANDEEFYRAFSKALREEIMINWMATDHTLSKKGIRKFHYLSMEYMPGKMLGNTITNINATDLVKRVLKILKRDYQKILSMEPDIGIGNGGLGRLASCFLDSLATLQYPAIGYGMRYQYGIFEQELWCGVQIERPDCWLLTENPWEFRRDSHAYSVNFSGNAVQRSNSHGDEVYDLIAYEEVRALAYDLPIVGYSKDSDFSVLTLRLWSTKESPRNFQLQSFNAGEIGQASENTMLTDVLYPNDNHELGKKIRLKQEFLLVSASIQDIFQEYNKTYTDFSSFPDVVRIQINDTHPALVIAELMRILIKECDIPWGKAWEITKTCCGYTNHTVLREALEEWNGWRVLSLLPRQYRIIERINYQFCQEIRAHYPNEEKRLQDMSIIENGQIRMANLAIYGSSRINGVANLHTEILKSHLLKNFYEMYKEKFASITNGVTQRRWLLYSNPKLASFLEKRIGKGWITDFGEIKKIGDFATDRESQEEFLRIKKENKENLLQMLHSELSIRHGIHEELAKHHLLGSDALFDVLTKRIHEYKRQLLKALHLLILYQEIKENPKLERIKRLAIFGGKAPPGYQFAKNIIRFIYCLERKINYDPDTKNHLKVVFVENYNVSKAEVIIPATDLSEQISTAGMEASGTGNMKFAINGALTISTDDGSNIEIRESITDNYWPFHFGASAEENQRLRDTNSYNPFEIYANHPMINKAMNSLTDRSLVENEAEHEALIQIYKNLLEGTSEKKADYFFVLRDLPSYYSAQRKVGELYQNPLRWAEFAIRNMAGMGPFSSDVSIKNYAKYCGLEVCPPDPTVLARVRQEYSEHDRCRIFPTTHP